MAIVFKDNIEVPDIEIGGVALGTLAFSSATIPTDNNQLANGAGYVTSSGNTTIGINQNNTLNTSTVFATLNFTNGVATSATTRTLTLGNLGFTGASNANYITNNNQLTNGAGYTTNTGTVTTVTGISPISVTTPTTGVKLVSMSVASPGANGYLTSTDWNTFNNKTSNTGTITNVTAGTGMSGGGSSGSVTLNNTITNNNQLTNGAGYITSVPTSNKGSWSPENAQTIAGSGSLEARVTIEFDTSEITEVGMTASAVGEVSITSAQLVMISFNFASENGASPNRLLAGAVLQYQPYRGSYADIQGTQVFNYVRGNGTVDRDSGSATVLYNVGALSKIRAQFWIQGRAATTSALISLISGCRLSINQIT